MVPTSYEQTELARKKEVELMDMDDSVVIAAGWGEGISGGGRGYKGDKW